MSIVLEAVTKRFAQRASSLSWSVSGERFITALDAVSSELSTGHVTAVLGENGSGKTTLLKLIAGMLLPDAGRITVAGHDTSHDNAAIRRRVGFAVAAERSFYPRLTARENLEFFAALEEVPSAERRARVADVLDTVELTQHADRPTMAFSSGMYQRLGIARALLKRPAILLLDEPSRSLDPAATEHLWNWLWRGAAGGATVVLATHNFEEAARAANYALFLHRGRIRMQRPIAGLSALELRDLYFAEATEIAAAAGGHA